MKKKRGEKFLESINIKASDKYVCLCIRDKAYLKEKFPNKDFSYHDYRDHKIENFYLMADTLVDLGYKVLRMGNMVEKPFNNGNKNIIDYASLKNRSDFNDIFLFSNCEFVISTSLGVDEFALMFRKPLVNCVVPIIGFKTYSHNIINFSKHHFSKKLNRNLKLSEMTSFYQNKSQNVHLAENFLQNEIIFKDNSPEEWKSVALEMIERINNIPIDNDDRIQKTFWNNFKEMHKKIDTTNLNQEASRDINEFIINKELVSKISVAFIEKNKEWMN